MDNKGQAVTRRYSSLKSERSTWEGHWDEVAKFIIPKKDDVYGGRERGSKVGNTLFDTKAIKANDDLSSALHGMLTSPSLVWFGLETGEASVDLNENVRGWLFDSTLKMINAMNQSNFQTEIHEVYQDLGSTGTAGLIIEEDEDEIINFSYENVHNMVIDEDHRGRVNYFAKEYELSVRQIMDKFPDLEEGELRDRLFKESVNNPAKRFKIIQEVMKRSKAEMEGGVGTTAMEYQSIHVMKEGGETLKESGFEEFPAAIVRWSKNNKEKYGRSPGMKTLSDIKMANQMKKVTLQGAQLAVAPPLQVPDNGFLAPLNLRPFGTNYYRGNSKNRIEPLLTGAQPQLGEGLLEIVHVSIREHFLTDKLVTPQNDRMTATEIIQRRDEQLRFLGPVLGRLDRELLKKIVDRVFSIMLRKKLFLEMPKELVDFIATKGGRFDLLVKYRSTIAQAQLITQSENISRAVNATSFVIGSQPEVMDNIDGDKLLKKNFKIFGVDPDIQRSEDEVTQIRQQRAEAAQAQAQREAAESESGTIKNMSEAENVR